MALKNLFNPTLEQLTDSNLASDEDIPLIVKMHNDWAKCREQTIKDHMDVNPGAVPILIQGYQAQNIILADLINVSLLMERRLRNVLPSYLIHLQRFRHNVIN